MPLEANRKICFPRQRTGKQEYLDLEELKVLIFSHFFPGVWNVKICYKRENKLKTANAFYILSDGRNY